MPGRTIFRRDHPSKGLGPVFVVAGTILTSFARSAHAVPAEPRFCVVPVKNGVPMAADVGQAWRVTNVSFRIPGLPSLVFTPQNRGGQWTIDANRRLVRYAGLFPHTFLDKSKWVLEPWSSRVVAVTTFGGASFLRSGGPGFEEFDNGRTGSFLSVYVLPRRRLTVVTTTNRGTLIAGERALAPWCPPRKCPRTTFAAFTAYRTRHL
jgi:hypothetical protein